jgi:hypothetical protein
MVRPTFWFVAGAASGVYAMVKARRAVEVLTPDGIGARVAAVRAGARQFAGDVASAADAREADLLAELRAEAAAHRQIEARAHHRRTDSPPVLEERAHHHGDR